MNDDPAPTAEDYRRADLLIEGAGWAEGTSVRDLLAGGIAVARTGGDVAEYLARGLQA